MRGVLAALLLMASPAMADDYLHYTNSHWGFELDIPPGYVGRAETGDQDGQLFQGDTSEIIVMGAPMDAADFEAQATQQQQETLDAGWGFVFKLSTPQAVSFGGKKGSQHLWVGLIPVCGGKGFAQVYVTYGSADGVEMQRPVSRMERSLRSTGTCEAI